MSSLSAVLVNMQISTHRSNARCMYLPRKSTTIQMSSDMIMLIAHNEEKNKMEKIYTLMESQCDPICS